MKLIVGLGNPGPKYAGHRHNIGFMALDRLAERHRFTPWRKRFQGLTADGEIDGHKALLLKPETFMNESGRAVGEAMRYLKLTPADVMVLHDELDLEPGRVKVKVGGGNAGHNGLRSISAHIGNEYPRVRLGIGHPGHKDLVAGYVLHDFASADRTWREPLLDAIADTAGTLLAGPPEAFGAAIARLVGEAAPPPARGDARRGRDAAGSDERTPTPRHPAGERQSKRDGALAENLRKFLARRDGG
jgi:PTH1 family peptidyl-tRNA hydrolase